MSSCASFIFLFLFSFLICFRASAQNPNFLHSQCSNTTYSSNSTYFTNLRTLLSSLSSPNASYSTGFQDATVGQAADKVTGIFLCHGDLSPEVCRNCVAFSVNDTLVWCPKERQAVIFYDECMLRYSDQNILSNLTPNGGWRLLNNNNISSDLEGLYVGAVASMMNQAAFEAASSSRKFAAIKTTWAIRTALQSLYVLVQCTPDLTSSDCSGCLQRCIYGIPHNRIGGRYLFPSCNARYELYAFYNETAVTTPPSPPSTYNRFGGRYLLPRCNARYELNAFYNETAVTTPPPPPSPPSTSPVSSPPRPGKGVIAVAIVVPTIVAVLLFIDCYCFFEKRTKKTSDTALAFDGDDITSIESLQLDYRTIQAATNDFSENNKIGRGGFGVVYKGTFSNGTEVAVKRLSKSSGQGDTEFKNEVVVVAKLQHRNLVRLLGFSLKREERILVYEYVPNKSLDYFFFDPAKKGQLNWTVRYKIIEGIARGILYLHQDSRLTIIHRDLKASNILLDTDMNPKIADFGIARIFGMDQIIASTTRVVGTFGYMSPEYVTHGQFSTKLDVYSFGVLILEIISGKKNSSFYQMDGLVNNLVTYVWGLWEKKSLTELIDPDIIEDCKSDEVIRCIHIGLLCVQENYTDRPAMPTVHQMLTTSSITLPVPLPPGFFFRNAPGSIPLAQGLGPGHSSGKTFSCSVNEATITDLNPR